MSETALEFFSLTAYYTREHVRESFRIGIPITKSTYSESLAVPVSNVIKQFSLGSKVLGMNSDGGTNLARFMAILESNFDNIGVNDLVKPMFVMDFLAHVLFNSLKAVVTYVQSDDGNLYTELTSSNIQR